MVDLFKRLKNLSDDQDRAIRSGNTELLMKIVKQKQDVIEEINKFKANNDYDQLPDKEKKEITAIIEEQLKIDMKNQDNLLGLMAELKDKLTEVVKGKTVAKSYLQKGVTDPRFFDVSG